MSKFGVRTCIECHTNQKPRSTNHPICYTTTPPRIHRAAVILWSHRQLPKAGIVKSRSGSYGFLLAHPMYPGSELTFVNVQNPNDVVTPSLRHKIRSRAAFHTHECRLKTTLPLQLSQSVGQYNVLVPRYTPHKEASSSKQSTSSRKRLRSASTYEQHEIDAAIKRKSLKERLSTTFATAPVPHERWHAEMLDVCTPSTVSTFT